MEYAEVLFSYTFASVCTVLYHSKAKKLGNVKLLWTTQRKGENISYAHP